MRIHGIEESVTYQAIVEEGRVKGELKGMLRARQDDILQLGRRRFGATSADTEAALRDIADAERLSRLHGALLDVSTWDELLATP